MECVVCGCVTFSDVMAGRKEWNVWCVAV